MSNFNIVIKSDDFLHNLYFVEHFLDITSILIIFLNCVQCILLGEETRLIHT